MRTRVMPLPDWRIDLANWKYHLTTWDRKDPPHSLVSEKWSGGSNYGAVPYANLTKGRRITVDENHGLQAQKLASGQARLAETGDIGGYFDSISTSTRVFNGGVQHLHVSKAGGLVEMDYFGPILPLAIEKVGVPGAGSSQNLTALGATAISRCKPTNHVANLGQALAETLHDGIKLPLQSLRHIGNLFKGPSRMRNLAKAPSGDFLNMSFDWLPLIGDVRSTCYAAANAGRLIKSYEQNAGKVVKRRYEFPLERTSIVEKVQAGYEPEMMASWQEDFVDYGLPGGNVYRKTEFYRRTWFSGAFTYHLPSNYKSRNGLMSAAAKAQHLLGLELTPELLWQLTPWSWAVDWFSNTGDVISNLSDWATDGLVLKYGYIMEHTISEVTYLYVGPCRLKPVGTIYPASITSRYERKRREPAGPFGFGMSWNSLSRRQLATAAALGITRT